MTKTTANAARWDAPFWAVLVLGALSVGSLACFGFAAAQPEPPNMAILSTDNISPPAEF